MPIPHKLMAHRIDHYSQSVNTINGEDRSSWELRNRDIPANVQEAQPEIVEQYKSRESRLKQSAFIVDGSVAATINENDQIDFRGNRYRVAGVVNLSNLDRVWRIDLAEVIT